MVGWWVARVDRVAIEVDLVLGRQRQTMEERSRGLLVTTTCSPIPSALEILQYRLHLTQDTKLETITIVHYLPSFLNLRPIFSNFRARFSNLSPAICCWWERMLAARLGLMGNSPRAKS